MKNEIPTGRGMQRGRRQRLKSEKSRSVAAQRPGKRTVFVVGEAEQVLDHDADRQQHLASAWLSRRDANGQGVVDPDGNEQRQHGDAGTDGVKDQARAEDQGVPVSVWHHEV